LGAWIILIFFQTNIVKEEFYDLLFEVEHVRVVVLGANIVDANGHNRNHNDSHGNDDGVADGDD
jgi:hypothetical protein